LAAQLPPYIHKDVLDPLLKANEIAKQRGKEITVISATRSMERQQALWDTALKKYGNETEARKFVSMPSCRSPHLTGRAVDLCLKNSPTCEKISGAFADLKDPDVQLLQDIMRQAGWKRYCKEWWHFEYGLDLPSRCSP